MPCAAGSLCKVKPDHTPAPPLFTDHQCHACGSYLHGLCGLPDPRGDNETQRICHGCVNSNNRKEPSVDSDAGAASSKLPCKVQCTRAEVSPRPPPYTKVARQFGDLEGVAERCGMTEVSYHLGRAKLAWMSAFASKKTRQTSLADFV